MALNLDRVAKFAESLMIDEVAIYRYGRMEDSDTGARNETTGEYDTDRVERELVYEGEAMLYNRRTDASQQEEGGETRYNVQSYCSLPRDTDWRFKPEDELEVVDVNPEGDVSMIGNVYLLEIADQGTYIATRELAMITHENSDRT